MTVVYRPIPIEGATAENADLVGVKLDRDALFADFTLEEARTVLHVTIRGVIVHRLVSGVTIPVDEIEPNLGLSRSHLAYSVTGSRLFSAFMASINGHSAHYRFLTGNSCLDVLAKGAPLIRAIVTAR